MPCLRLANELADYCSKLLQYCKVDCDELQASYRAPRCGAAVILTTHILLQDVFDLAKLVGNLLVPALAKIFVRLATLRHLDPKLESSLGVCFFGALVCCPLLLSVKVISRFTLLLQSQPLSAADGVQHQIEDL